MTATSFTHYTSIGLDDELLRDGVVVRRYWRLRWPGNGAVFIGAGHHLRDDLTVPSERFDLAAAFFSPTTAPSPDWNGRLLGIRIASEVYDGAASHWVGVPAFYIPVLVSAIVFFRRRY